MHKSAEWGQLTELKRFQQYAAGFVSCKSWTPCFLLSLRIRCFKKKKKKAQLELNGPLTECLARAMKKYKARFSEISGCFHQPLLKMFREIRECFIVDISSLNLMFIGVCFHGGEFPRLLLTITSKGHWSNFSVHLLQKACNPILNR